MPSKIQQITQALRQRGFAYTHSEIGYAYEGPVHINGQCTKLRVILEDDSFVEPPLIQLLERPTGLPNIIPHISAEGIVCYAAKGTLALDVFDPVGQTLACLDRAIEIIERAIAGEMEADLAEEFFAYWPGCYALADVRLTRINTASAFLCENKLSGQPILVMTDNVARTRNKLSSSVFTPDAETVDIQVCQAARNPGIRQASWPPQTIGEFLSWQGELDAHCARRIKDSLLRLMKKNQLRAVTLVQSPTSWYGILTTFAKPIATDPLFERLNHLPRLLRSQIIPLSVVRIDDDYLAGRNVPDKKNLTGLRIALIGCGTVGGFLADLLVRAGAGLQGGELALVDSEVFLPGNLGRHRLGLSAIFKSKALELAEDLKRIIPGAQITGHPVDVRKMAALGEFDLVIDATGEEALSNHLNAKFHGENFVPMIFTWIHGAGEQVEVLIRDEKNVGCYQCLSLSKLEANTQTNNAVWAGHGCESLYVPFPASVSVSAAALALDAVLDWRNGLQTPRHRTRAMGYRSASPEPISDLSIYPECPVCRS